MSDESKTPGLSRVLANAIARNTKNLRVSLPARVESYDPATQQISAQPLIYDGFTDDSGNRSTEKLPIINSIPVMTLSGGGFQISLPLTVGDTVLLIFSSSSLDRWLSKGGEIDPGSDRRHDLNDAIAIPGLHDFAHALTMPGDSIFMGKSGAHGIKISPSDIQAGGTQSLALKSDVTALANFVQGLLVGGTGSVVVPPGTVPLPTGTVTLKGG